MAIWIPLAIGAGLGALKHYAVDKPQHKRQQLAQAEMTKYSPWTGMKGKILTPPSAFGSMLQGAATGAMFGSMAGGGGAGAAKAGAAGGAAGAKPVAMNYQGGSWAGMA